ncbi:MAG: glycoside hydrolase [Acidobacteria bacterium]|nr:glycoside hydrolase [Acidobacteriota bacterium]MCI0720334.1 glycoside hydrolase [Acidobacteriota bacterium]
MNWLLFYGVVLFMRGTPAYGEAKQGQVALEQQTIFRSGESSYNCFRIPALVVSGKGVILAFAEARMTNCGDDANIDLVFKRSLDNGKTWGPLQLLQDDGAKSVNQPTPVLDRQTGIVWLVFCKNNQTVFVMKTQDDGVTWSDPVEITRQVVDPTWKYIGAGPGHAIQLKNGRLLIPAWGDTSPGEASWPRPKWGKISFSFAFFSDDHGLTWKRGRPMYENLSDECMAVEATDGRVYMALRSLRHVKKKRAYAWSDDGGYSWSKIQHDDTLPDPHCQGSIVRFTSKGKEAKNRILFANPASEIDRVRMTVRMSEDDGKTWPVSKVLYEGLSAYSDLAIAADQTILCLYEADDYTHLRLARFSSEWLTGLVDRP